MRRQKNSDRFGSFSIGLHCLMLLLIAAVCGCIELQGDSPVGSGMYGAFLAAKPLHVALYVWISTMPILVWLTVGAECKAVPLFAFQLPAPLCASKIVAKLAKEFHETGGTIGNCLIRLQAAAALFHHSVAGDNTLRRMPLSHH